MVNDEEKWELPEKFRLSGEIIAASDKQQQIWAEQFNSPFSQSDGKTRERGLALIKIREYHEIGLKNLAENQLLELAESYAIIGRFDEAADVAQKTSQTLLYGYYLLVWAAIWREDAKWCECGVSHVFVEKDIWSVKHSSEMPLLKCNNCSCLNVAPLPKSIERQRTLRQRAINLTKGMGPRQAKEFLERNNHTHEKLLGK